MIWMSHERTDDARQKWAKGNCDRGGGRGGLAKLLTTYTMTTILTKIRMFSLCALSALQGAGAWDMETMIHVIHTYIP